MSPALHGRPAQGKTGLQGGYIQVDPWDDLFIYLRTFATIVVGVLLGTCRVPYTGELYTQAPICTILSLKKTSKMEIRSQDRAISSSPNGNILSYNRIQINNTLPKIESQV